MGLGVWTVGGTDTYKLTDYNNLVFYWEQRSDIETNTSDLYWEVRLTSTTHGFIQSSVDKLLAMRIGLGSYPYYVNLEIGSDTQKLLASDTVSGIRHNLDGTGSVAYTINLHANISFGGIQIGNVTFNGDCVFDTIPRSSTVTATGSTMIGEEMKFNFTRYSSGMNDTITYEFGENTGTIAEHTRDSVVSWTIPEYFYLYLGSAETQRVCTFTITTYDNNWRTLGKITITKMISANPDKCAPTFHHMDLTESTTWRDGVYFYDINPTTLALTHTKDKIIKYFNTVYCYLKAVAHNGAFLDTFIIENDGKEIARDRNVGVINKFIDAEFNNLTSGSFTIKATDTRGYSTKASFYIKVIDYTKLTCSISDILFNEDTGAATISIDGKFYKGIFDNDLPYVGETNNLTIEYRYRLNNEDYPTEWTTAYNGAGDAVLSGSNGYKTNIEITGLNPKFAYYVQIRVKDKLMTVELDDRSLTITPIFNWGKGDFQFNVPLNCDEGLNIEGQPVKDFVVETGTAAMGTNGTWYWQKWNSGRAECYGCRNYGNTAVTTAWGGLYRSEAFSQSLPSGLFLNMPDVIDVSFRNSNFGAWIAKHEASDPSETSTGSFIVVRPASATLSQAKISFNVIGRWK